MPPSCRPECTSSSECISDKACINRKCADPCPGVCGQRAICQVRNHSPICSCRSGLTGDPFVRCYPVPPSTPPKHADVLHDPCVPSPCGPYATCLNQNNVPSCTCLPNYIGAPPNCRPECTVNSDCISSQACINERCRDPCPGACGVNTVCSIINHTPNCACQPGYIGDAFVACHPAPAPRKLNFF